MVAWSEVKQLVGEIYEPETRTKRVADTMTYLGAEKLGLPLKYIEAVAALSTVDGLSTKKGEIVELAAELYELEKRPKLVAEYATALGAEKLLSAEKIAELAALSTSTGLKGKKAEIKDLAAPYIAKAYDAEGRKELVVEATDLATEKVLKPVKEYTTEKVEAVRTAASEKVLKPTKELAEPYLARSSEIAAPYIAKSTEIAAPYIAKIESKRAELVASKRFEKAVVALQGLREHPMETATDLKAQAIDLLKYDSLAQYREYVLSEEFQADTLKLIKVELPTIASVAAARGVEQVKLSATSLASDIDAKRGQIVLALERGYSAARKVELADLKDKFKELAAELQAEITSGAEHVKAEGFSLADAVLRMKKLAGAIDSILIAPLMVPADDAQDEAPTELAPADLPSSGSPIESPKEPTGAPPSEGDDEAFADAEETPEEEEEKPEPELKAEPPEMAAN